MTKSGTTTPEPLREKSGNSVAEVVDTTKDATGFEDNAALGNEQEKNMPPKTAFKYY